MWGKHLIIDMTAGDKERVRSAAHITRFVETLVETINMKAFGAPLLEHFAERGESAALQKLAAQEFPGEETALHAEFLGAIGQLEKQVLQQRVDELQQRMSELDEAEKYELRALLQSRLRP